MQFNYQSRPLLAVVVVSCPQVREIWLSSEDTGAYGRDIGTDLPTLLRRMIEVLPADGSTRLRVGEWPAACFGSSGAAALLLSCTVLLRLAAFWPSMVCCNPQRHFGVAPWSLPGTSLVCRKLSCHSLNRPARLQSFSA